MNIKEPIYRVWCIDKNQWVKDDCLMNQYGSLMHFDGRHFVLLKEENHIVQWHTGLKDRSGKGIYVGDIIKTEKSEVVTTGETLVGLDDWGSPIYSPAHKIKRCTHYGEVKRNYDGQYYVDGSDFSIAAIGIEVVGNIYENPELLNIKEG